MNKFYYSDGSTGTSDRHDDSKDLHRVGGPAAEFTNGTKAWLINGKYHRVDGPAIEYDDGAKEWWVNGEHYDEEDFNKLDKSQWMINKVEVEVECTCSSRDLFNFGCKCDYSKRKVA